MTDINGIFSFCEAVGTAAFAVSGAMVAVDRGTDIFGVLLMAVFTALGALGTTPWLFAILMGLAGLFCAPSIAAISERLGDIVPENSRGEAFGWQGTFNTLGSAMAPPMIGWVMDGHGWQLGLVATGFAGLALATLGWIALRLGRRGIARRRAA